MGENGQKIVSRWHETLVNNIAVENPNANIYNIQNFPTVQVEIDFENPAAAQNQMVLLTESVETDSGVAKFFKVDKNVGEGWVWTFRIPSGGLVRFKTKGEKHAKSKVKKFKVKTLKTVDEAKEKAKVEFANYACPAWRLEQAWQTTFGIENEKMAPTKKEMGNFLRAVIADVMKEEMDVLKEKELKPKDVT